MVWDFPVPGGPWTMRLRPFETAAIEDACVGSHGTTGNRASNGSSGSASSGARGAREKTRSKLSLGTSCDSSPS